MYMDVYLLTKYLHRLLQPAWKKRAFRHSRFACINLLSKMYKGSTFFDSTALRANSQPSFFHAFLIYSGLLLFFHCWIPVLMRKVRIFEFLCPKKHSKIRTGSIRKPPVSLLPLKNFFHADALFCIGCFLRQISKEPDKNAQRFFMLCKKGHAEWSA